MRSLAQTLMEWPPLVRVYESRIWRRSLLFAAFLGISFEREYSLIAAAANLKGDELVLDLACGPGIYARPFARRLPRGHVIGLDLSAPMLRYASKRARKDGLTNLQLLRGDAMELPFRSEAFQAVNCCGALHLFPDPGHVLKEIHRVLGAGGSLTPAAFRHAENPLGRLRADIRRQLYGLASFSAKDLNSMLTTAGFSGVRQLHAAGPWLIVAAIRS
jgi:SAM-dependent methyltransferase